MGRSSVINAAVVTVAIAVMLATMGRAVAGLVAALVTAYLIALRPVSADQLRSALRAYLIALGAQGAHLVEEYHTEFYREFPPLLGAAAWSGTMFLVFNLAWLIVFGFAAIGLMRGSQLAFVIALFLALGGGLLNGVAHAVFAVIAGGYFPGLFTAPLVFGAGGYLTYRLLRHSGVPVAAI